MAREPRFPVTAEHVREWAQEVRSRFPDADEVFYDYTVASEVIINILGPSWWALRLAGSKADPYFVKDAEDTPGRYRHQSRVIVLARDLLRCQDAPGFAEQLDQIRPRSLIGVFHEIRVAALLRASGHAVEFVIPTQQRGADFDLLVEGQLAVEVKAREDNAEYGRASLESTLSAARRQLPKDRPGLVALRIPDRWARSAEFVADAEGILERALQKSRRMNAILVLWDEWVPAEPKGMACLTRFRVFVNASPRESFPNLERVIRAITITDG